MKHKTDVNMKKCCPHLRVFLKEYMFHIKYNFATAQNQKVCKINLFPLNFKHLLLVLLYSILGLTESQERSTFKSA